MQEISELLKKAVKTAFDQDIDVELTRPDEQFGDFASNIALQLSKKVGQNPREIAEKLASELQADKNIEKVEVAGPGFINITLSDETLWAQTNKEAKKPLSGKTVVAEYSDPNPFKVLHAGHLYTSIVGDAIANLYEKAGAKVYRVNFGGDVGLHVGKTVWYMLKDLKGDLSKLALIEKNDEEMFNRSTWMSQCYVKGTAAYEKDSEAKQEIDELNKKIYQLHEQSDHESDIAKLYWTTRQWSYEYFDKFYKSIGTKFDKYYPESEVVPLGLKTVKDNIGKIFEKSDGAVVFKGETHSLHTRVFINSAGLPTYETKDIGLALTKWSDYHFDKSLMITGNDIIEYMKVVMAALNQIDSKFAKNTTHLTHGMVKLSGGEKMSSRRGNILEAVYVLDVAEEASKKISEKNDWSVVLAAVKYAFLKQRIGGDIIYDPDESVSIHGNSGPYLQYAHARARSILAKAQKTPVEPEKLEVEERKLVRKLGEYSEVVDRAIDELMPHHICTYLYELSQTFNRFYEESRVIGDEREALRLGLVKQYADTLKSGLELLNIPAPEKM